MAKRNTIKQPRTVETGAGWYITFDPETRDYSAYYSDGEYIGSRPTQEAAFDAIWENFDSNARQEGGK